jgi:ABC-2 type transport system permease protein
MTAVTQARPAAARGRDDGESTLTGTGKLVRFMLRRDRIRIPVWLLALTRSAVGTASNLVNTYDTACSASSRSSWR